MDLGGLTPWVRGAGAEGLGHDGTIVSGPASPDRACSGGGQFSAAAASRFEVSPSAAIKLMRRVRQTGSPAPAQVGGHRRPLLEPHADLIRSLVEARPRITLAELRAALGEHGIRVTALSTLWLMVRRLGRSHKKTR